jgi:hypothetical protein
MTSDVKDIIGREVIKDGIRTFTGAKAQAARIVRTEGIRNLNAGTIAQYNQASSQGIDIKKQWLATLDIRTRSSHQNADLQIRELEEDFSVNGATGQAPGQLSSVGENANCRCTTLSVIPGVSPDLRVGINPNTGDREVFSFRGFKEWQKNNGLKQTPKQLIKPIV